MPWNVGQKILSFLELPRGQGWDKTVEKIIAEGENLDEYRNRVLEYLIKHYQCGEKMLRLHSVDRAIGEQIASAIRDAVIPPSSFLEHYPALVPSDQLNGLSTTPTLVNVTVGDGGTVATFASVRVLSVREELEREDFPEEAADALSRFDELVGIRHVKWQAMDVVKISPDFTEIDVRVDAPLGMPSTAGDVVHALIRKELALMTVGDLLPQPMNLFPLIDRIYKAEGEGIVVELAFGTTTASLKHEKMRRRRTCLRQEAYHRGGKRALASDIEIHRLSVLWPLPLGRALSRPELTLSASARSAGATHPILTNAMIRNCADDTEFEHVRSRMLHFYRLMNEERNENIEDGC
ncbi:hypothetical protein AncyloWKF20_16750 [Ancylobacter sp. WKF20]|uniref:hypothetical protein n=1 Tax=Ancylobacter sp. WKF20 TaxID=3039801 RepID=UPI002434566D|nr:hypothetical protein [Ancylobacter sp. WKF20]WGD29405.1 hypothetical protein AncyloWKF20_16750 [Ancylobacter sp. WKF20]